jgi:hypothetical protein
MHQSTDAKASPTTNHQAEGRDIHFLGCYKLSRSKYLDIEHVQEILVISVEHTVTPTLTRGIDFYIPAHRMRTTTHELLDDWLLLLDGKDVGRLYACTRENCCFLFVSSNIRSRTIFACAVVSRGPSRSGSACNPHGQPSSLISQG